ncbi:MAG: HAD-IIIA family hydrolase [Planctomycetota bacterium]
MNDERIARIKAVILDVDGVLTDGAIYVNGQGDETKRFNVRDGAAIKWLQRCGLAVAFLSGRTSTAVEARARQVGVEHVVQGATEKLPAYETLRDARGVKDEEVCYAGDDLHDLPVLRRAGFAAATADATGEARSAAHYVTQARGGEGAVRELAEVILKSQGSWETLTERYRK